MKPPKPYRRSKTRLTAEGKRRGRPAGYHTDEQHMHPLGRHEDRELSTLDVIRAVRSRTRPKYAQFLATLTEAGSHQKARSVKRVAKRLERLRARLAAITGIDRL